MRADTVVGVATVTLNEPFINGVTSRAVPVFNLAPAPGEPARLGFFVLHVLVVLDTSVRTGQDYGVVATVRNASQAAQVLSSRVTLWGVPGDESHDAARGWACVEGGEALAGKGEPCAAPAHRSSAPFLTLPTSCAGPPKVTAEGDSWSEPGNFATGEHVSSATEFLYRGGEGGPIGMEGCGSLPFGPSIRVVPEQPAGSTPTGLKVNVDVPQGPTLTASSLAEADVKDTTVTLPEGVQLSAGAAYGLLTCTAPEVGFSGLEQGLPEAAQTENDHFTAGLPTCPDRSKVGTVRIKTPLLANELEGSAYLAAQDTNPFEAPLVLYLVARDPVSGVLVKLAGKVTPDPVTGQLVSTFENAPPLPFEDLEVDFFGGPRASVSTPALCGTYVTQTAFASWSGGSLATPTSSFSITSGPGGSPCASSPLPFAPLFQAGVTNNQAGGFSPFTLSIERPDGDQALETVTMHLPPGTAALLSSVTPCPQPQVATGTCGPESLIGHSTASSGLGGAPYTLPGSVYLTGPYEGAPFGLSVVTPAVAGPFNLGDVIVNSTINVDPSTAAVTIASDPFPTILKGVPVQLKRINVTVDRPGFQFNPTSCNPMSVTGTLTGAQGASAQVASPFQVAGCAGLPFAPKLTATVGGHASKLGGTSLDVRVESAGLGQANIAKVDLQLPTALPSRLETLHKACPEDVFNSNPAWCDEGSVIGNATIHTPVLRSPLTGPAYLVSHGGAAFPDVEFVLQGEGIKLVLDGKTDIKKGITYSRFESAPDAPFTTFETELPAGPHGVLTAYVPKTPFNLCGTALTMPTEITGQNGALIKQATRIGIVGCGGVRSYRATRAQLLAKALKACRKNRKRSRRVACEKRARKRYAVKKPARRSTSSARRMAGR